MKCFATTILIFITGLLFAQVEAGLVTYMSFDDCTANESRGNTAVIGVIQGDTVCTCGVNQLQSLRFGTGGADNMFISGTVNSEFRTGDFTVSFYFKPLASSGFQPQTIFSKVDSDIDCIDENVFAIRYLPATRILNVQMIENADKSANIIGVPLPLSNCWYHVAVVRKSTRTILYVNGEYVTESGTVSRVDLQNTGVIKIGQSYCSASDVDFEGLFDELRIYNRPLDNDEVRTLYFPQDKIATPNSRIFVGESLDIEISETCANQFSWDPMDNVLDPEASNTSLSPTETTTYQLSFIESGCIATDTIRVVVIDPNTLDCEVVFLPKAFTPNGSGPAKNETFGLSNPEIFKFGSGQMESFEIFDRWGNKVFEALDPDERWDGNYKSEKVNPGVFLYKVRFTCNGEERIKAGSVTLMR